MRYMWSSFVFDFNRQIECGFPVRDIYVGFTS